MAGHIKLGLAGALKDYIADDVRNLVRSQAGPFSASVSTGGAYDSLEGWAQWTQQDWTAGAGQEDPEAGGLLFGTVDARVPRQLILPQRLWPTNGTAEATAINQAWRDANITSYVTVAPGTITDKYGYHFQTNVNMTSTTCIMYAYLKGDVGTTVTMSIYRASAGGVGALVDTATVVLSNKTKAPKWEQFDFGTAPTWHLVAPNDYLTIVISANAAITLYCFDSIGGTYRAVRYNGVALGWVLGVNAGKPGAIFHAANALPNEWFMTDIAEFNGTVYGTAERGTAGYVYKWNEANAQWSELATAIPMLSRRLMLVGNQLFVLTELPGINKVSTADVIAAGPADLSAYYLATYDERYWWFSNGVDIKYTADGTTFTTISAVGSAQQKIKAIAAMNNNLYFATERGIGYIAPGDFIVALTAFPSYSDNTTVRMEEFQGALFILANNILYRMDSSHALNPIPLPKSDPQLTTFGREITAIAAGMTWLYVATWGDGGGLIWLWTPEGWHIVAYAPDTVRVMKYSRVHEALWITTENKVWRMRLPDVTVNPYYDTGSRYDALAWCEFPKFYGGPIRLQKDFNSVYVDWEYDGDTAVSGSGIVETSVQVWFQDENSTEWELLGSLSAPGELEWVTTRSPSRWLKLALLLSTCDADHTPRVRGISVSYHPMVNDRFRFNVPILVHDTQQFPDGTMNSQTAAQMQVHLDSMIARVKPFIYQHEDGKQYEVKVISHSRQRIDADQNLSGPVRRWIYSLVLEQVSDGEYS